MCACACVCGYTLSPQRLLPSCDAWDIPEGTDQRSSVVSIMLGTSAKFLYLLHQNVVFHLQRRKLQREETEEKTIYMVPPKDDRSYILI